MDSHTERLQDHSVISQFIDAYSSFASNEPGNLDVKDHIITLRDKFGAHLTHETLPKFEEHVQTVQTNLLALEDVDVRVLAADQVSGLSVLQNHWHSYSCGWPEDKALVDVVFFTPASEQQADGDGDWVPDGSSMYPGSGSG